MTEAEQVELYEYYGRLVRYLVRAFNFKDEDARDIAQEVFLRVLVREEKPDNPWIFLKTAAHNRAVNVIRGEVGHRRWRAGSVDSLPNLSETFLRDLWTNEPPPSPETIASGNEEAAKLSEAIQKLPEPLRQCLLLWMNGLSYSQIAGALRITVEAVRTRLRDAKRRLIGGG
jgi:RNA polymerase sigma factor (sigma-70 family)